MNLGSLLLLLKINSASSHSCLTHQKIIGGTFSQGTFHRSPGPGCRKPGIPETCLSSPWSPQWFLRSSVPSGGWAQPEKLDDKVWSSFSASAAPSNILLPSLHDVSRATIWGQRNQYSHPSARDPHPLTSGTKLRSHTNA